MAKQRAELVRAEMTPRPHALLIASLSTLAWMFFSSAIIILNKNLYARGFERPFFVTGAGQLFSALGGAALAALGLLPLRKLPSTSFIATKLLPIILSATASKFFGNSCYLYLSVSFIQILKAFTPALTLLLCVAVGIEPLHWPLLLAVLLISIGTAVAVLAEVGGAMFSAWGLTSFMISSVAESARVVGADVLLGSSLSFNSAEVLVYVAGPTSAVLLLASVLFEDMAPGSSGWALISADPLPFLAAFSVSFLLNLCSFVAIQHTSSLTFKVAGCVKNVGMVWYQVVAHQERISLSQVAGYLVSVSGFAMYSRLKLMQQSPRPEALLKHKAL